MMLPSTIFTAIVRLVFAFITLKLRARCFKFLLSFHNPDDKPQCEKKEIALSSDARSTLLLILSSLFTICVGSNAIFLFLKLREKDLIAPRWIKIGVAGPFPLGQRSAAGGAVPWRRGVARGLGERQVATRASAAVSMAPVTSRRGGMARQGATCRWPSVPLE